MQPDHTVNLYFNTSNGPDADYRGPWNSEPAFQYISDPLAYERQQHGNNPQSANEMDMTTGMGPPPQQGAAPNLDGR